MHIQILNLPQPDIRPYSESGNERYVLNEDYIFSFKFYGVKREFKIKRGFKYDGASVPRIAMALIGFERDGIHRAASLVHDYIYSHQGYIKDNLNVYRVITRKTSDKLFLLGMEYHGIKSVHGRIGYLTVRAIGWMRWHKIIPRTKQWIQSKI